MFTQYDYFTGTNTTQLTQEDEGLRASQIPELFVNRYNEENLTDTVMYAIHTSDNQMAMRRTFTTLDCRVVSSKYVTGSR